MKVKIKFFTRLREITGKKEEEIELNSNVALDKFLRQLSKEYGQEFQDYIWDRWEQPRGTLQFLINGKNIMTLHGFETELKDGDIIAIIPPIGGG